MAVMAVLFWTARAPLAGLFLDPATPEGAAALGYAIVFLRIAALFQLVDGLQVIGIASLRGLKDTAVPMWLAAFGYWVVGFPICWLLGFHTPLGGTGIWIGLAFALATVAVTMVVRFDRLTRRRGSHISPAERRPGDELRDSACMLPARVLLGAPARSRRPERRGHGRAAVPGLRQLPQADQPGRSEADTRHAYRVLGRNDVDGEWLQVLLPGLEPQQRWISVGCGRLAWRPHRRARRVCCRSSTMSPSPARIRRRRRPPLDALDRAVLDVCGDWGSRPRAREFRAMLDRPEVAEDVRQLYAALDRSVRGGPVGLQRFKDELTAVWFDAGGFAHVFCGEPRADGLGGLHYRGRYLQLQELGQAGLMTAAECRGHRDRRSRSTPSASATGCPAAARCAAPAPRAIPTIWAPASC